MKYRMKRHAVVQPQNESYRLIPLTRNLNAIVDAEDFDWLNQWNWFAYRDPRGNNFYAARRPTGGRIIKMHRFILGIDRLIDHANRNTLDNRRENLRVCSALQNSCNRKPQVNNKSGYKGVYPFGNKWIVGITHKGKFYHLGLFHTPEQAALAYNKAARKFHGKFAFLNHVMSRNQ